MVFRGGTFGLETSVAQPREGARTQRGFGENHPLQSVLVPALHHVEGVGLLVEARDGVEVGVLYVVLLAGSHYLGYGGQAGGTSDTSVKDDEATAIRPRVGVEGNRCK